jgi:hypothetical protein
MLGGGGLQSPEVPDHELIESIRKQIDTVFTHNMDEQLGSPKGPEGDANNRLRGSLFEPPSPSDDGIYRSSPIKSAPCQDIYGLAQATSFGPTTDMEQEAERSLNNHNINHHTYMDSDDYYRYNGISAANDRALDASTSMVGAHEYDSALDISTWSEVDGIMIPPPTQAELQQTASSDNPPVYLFRLKQHMDHLSHQQREVRLGAMLAIRELVRTVSIQHRSSLEDSKVKLASLLRGCVLAAMQAGDISPDSEGSTLLLVSLEAIVAAGHFAVISSIDLLQAIVLLQQNDLQTNQITQVQSHAYAAQFTSTVAPTPGPPCQELALEMLTSAGAPGISALCELIKDGRSTCDHRILVHLSKTPVVQSSVLVSMLQEAILSSPASSTRVTHYLLALGCMHERASSLQCVEFLTNQALRLAGHERWYACWALRMCGGKAGLKALLQLARAPGVGGGKGTKDFRVRAAAIWALGHTPTLSPLAKAAAEAMAMAEQARGGTGGSLNGTGGVTVEEQHQFSAARAAGPSYTEVELRFPSPLTDPMAMDAAAAAALSASMVGAAASPPRWKRQGEFSRVRSDASGFEGGDRRRGGGRGREAPVSVRFCSAHGSSAALDNSLEEAEFEDTNGASGRGGSVWRDVWAGVPTADASVRGDCTVSRRKQADACSDRRGRVKGRTSMGRTAESTNKILGPMMLDDDNAEWEGVGDGNPGNGATVAAGGDDSGGYSPCATLKATVVIQGLEFMARLQTLACSGDAWLLGDEKVMDPVLPAATATGAPVSALRAFNPLRASTQGLAARANTLSPNSVKTRGRNASDEEAMMRAVLNAIGGALKAALVGDRAGSQRRAARSKAGKSGMKSVAAKGGGLETKAGAGAADGYSTSAGGEGFETVGADGDKEGVVLRAALSAISILGLPHAISLLPTLLRLLEHPHDHIRTAAVHAVGRLGLASLRQGVAGDKAAGRAALTLKDRRHAGVIPDGVIPDGFRQAIAARLRDSFHRVRAEALRVVSGWGKAALAPDAAGAGARASASVERESGLDESAMVLAALVRLLRDGLVGRKLVARVLGSLGSIGRAALLEHVCDRGSKTRAPVRLAAVFGLSHCLDSTCRTIAKPSSARDYQRQLPGCQYGVYSPQQRARLQQQQQQQEEQEQAGHPPVDASAVLSTLRSAALDPTPAVRREAVLGLCKLSRKLRQACAIRIASAGAAGASGRTTARIGEAGGRAAAAAAAAGGGGRGGRGAGGAVPSPLPPATKHLSMLAERVVGLVCSTRLADSDISVGKAAAMGLAIVAGANGEMVLLETLLRPPVDQALAAGKSARMSSSSAGFFGGHGAGSAAASGVGGGGGGGGVGYGGADAAPGCCHKARVAACHGLVFCGPSTLRSLLLAIDNESSCGAIGVSSSAASSTIAGRARAASSAAGGGVSSVFRAVCEAIERLGAQPLLAYWTSKARLATEQRLVAQTARRILKLGVSPGVPASTSARGARHSNHSVAIHGTEAGAVLMRVLLGLEDELGPGSAGA